MNKIFFLIATLLILIIGLGISKRLNAETLIYLQQLSNLEKIHKEKNITSFIKNEQLEQQAQQLYENGNFTASIETLEQLINYYSSQGDLLNQLFASRNLALVYTKIGNFKQAQQIIDNVINQAIILQNNQLLAQSLDVQGQIQLSTGQTEEALETWQKVSKIYNENDNFNEWIQAQINQVKTLQALGLYNQATKIINIITKKLEAESNTPLKAQALQTLGDFFRSSRRLRAV